MTVLEGFGLGLIVGAGCVLALIWYFDPTRGCQPSVSYYMRPKQITRKVRGPYKRKENAVSVPIPAETAPEVKAEEEYAVAGQPRKPSWRVRKRELEAAEKTKRKQRDEYREIG
jgi:hypothetical protein